MSYIVSYPVMERWLGGLAVADSGEYEMPYHVYASMIRRMLEPVAVDEDWYLTTYPHLTAAIRKGVFRSARQHYLLHGYFEERFPYAADLKSRPRPVPFRDIRAATPARPARGGLLVRLTRPALTDIVRKLLQSVPVDEQWYCQTYPGVGEAIARGDIRSAATHFAEFGYFEARWPFAMKVDHNWYVNRYPDAQQAIKSGDVASAQEHFWRIGYRQGRFPTRTPQF